MRGAQLSQRYQDEFMAAPRVHAILGRHANVLVHVVGFFMEKLEPEARREQCELIADYRTGLVPLIVRSR